MPAFNVNDPADLAASRARARAEEKRRLTLLERARVAHAKAKALRMRRDRQLAALKTDPSAQAVRWALDQVAVVEHPAASNRGPRIDAWQVATIGRTGLPWCQAFANAVLVHGGGVQLKSAYTPQVVDWARDRRFGLRLVGRSLSLAKPGDMVFFKFPGVSDDFCDHVGIYVSAGRTVEGNTSSGNGGSQNNGGGVFLRQRPASQVVAVVRPTYH